MMSGSDTLPAVAAPDGHTADGIGNSADRFAGLLDRPAAGGGVRMWFERYDRRLHERLGVTTTTDLFQLTVAVWLALAALTVVTGFVWGSVAGSAVAAVTVALAGFGSLACWRWWLGERQTAGRRTGREGFYRSARQRRMELLGREGLADHREVERAFGADRLIGKADVLRPVLTQTNRPVRAADVGWCAGKARSVDVWLSIEHPELYLGPPRSGKGFQLVINAIMAAPGPVIASSVRSDNMAATIKGRSLVGPVAVFDPEGVSGRESTFRWSPLAGCEDPRVAQRRAQVLVAGTGISRGDNAVWGSTAGGILQALLHAAALDGRSIHDLYRWAQSPAHMGEAARILENQSTEDWATQLEAIKASDARLQGSQFLGVKEAMRPLDLDSVRTAFDVSADQATDIAEFLAASGTLYPIARWSGEDSDSPSTGRYVTLLFDEFVSTAREVSQTTGLNRLDPPLTIVADELANMHPWANLGQAFAAGSGEGVKVCAVFQSLSQVRTGWGPDVADTLWNSANVIVLGGNKNPADLEAISKLLADRVVSQTHDTWSEVAGWFRRGGAEQLSFRPVMMTDDIRRIPEGCGLLIAEANRPVLVDLEPWPARPWGELVRESQAWHVDHPSRPGVLAPAYTNVMEGAAR
jgi:hypothetical protein